MRHFGGYTVPIEKLEEMIFRICYLLIAVAVDFYFTEQVALVFYSPFG